MLTAVLLDTGEAGADFHALHGVDSHHGVGDIRIQAIEYRLPKARHYPGGNHIDARPYGVPALVQGRHECLHLRHFRRVRAEEGIGFHGIPIQGLGDDGSQLGQVTANLDAVAPGKVLLRYGSRRDSHGGFPGGGTAAAPVIPKAVFLVVSVVGMGRPEGVLDIRVIPGALVGVFYEQADGRTGGAPLEHAGQDAHLICFAPLGGVPGSTRLAPVQVSLQVAGGQFQAGRAAVHDASQGRAVALSEAGYREQFTDCIACHVTPVPVRKSPLL